MFQYLKLFTASVMYNGARRMANIGILNKLYRKSAINNEKIPAPGEIIPIIDAVTAMMSESFLSIPSRNAGTYERTKA